MRKNSFIQGALILTVAGIIVKFIGAFSRIYLSRLLGGEGIGLYQMAYPIYLLCLSVSSAGLPVAISIMVAERNAVNDYNGGQKVFRISMAALVMTGLFSVSFYSSAPSGWWIRALSATPGLTGPFWPFRLRCSAPPFWLRCAVISRGCSL